VARSRISNCLTKARVLEEDESELKTGRLEGRCTRDCALTVGVATGADSEATEEEKEEKEEELEAEATRSERITSFVPRRTLSASSSCSVNQIEFSGEIPLVASLRAQSERI